MKQFNGIELCRIGCAFSVITWHYQHFFFFGAKVRPVFEQIRPSFPFYEILKPFYCEGFLAVQLFWTISGFIFFWKYSDQIYKKGVCARNFFVLRFTRLYPLHFATLILVLILQLVYRSSHQYTFIYQHNDIRHFALQLFFGSNWLGREPYTFNGPIWSVSIEVLAYIAFFFIVRLFSPNIILCFLVILVTKIALHFHTELVFSCFIFFFSGGLVERCIRRLSQKGREFAFWAASAAIVFMICSLHIGLHFSTNIQLLLSFFLVAWFSLIEDILPWSLSSFGWVGNMTYSSYLVHFPIQLLTVIIVDALGIKRTIFFNPEAFILFILVTFLAAFFVYNYFEKPLQNISRKRLLRARENSLF